MTEPLVDESHIAHLTTRWGGAFTTKMITLFLTQTEARIAAIGSGMTTDDLKAIEQAAHSLKSSAGNLGARPLMALCQAVETAAATGDTATVRATVPGLLANAVSTSEALATLRARLATTPAS